MIHGWFGFAHIEAIKQNGAVDHAAQTLLERFLVD